MMVAVFLFEWPAYLPSDSFFGHTKRAKEIENGVIFW
jgi:hypothetical protein